MAKKRASAPEEGFKEQQSKGEIMSCFAALADLWMSLPFDE